MKKSQLRNIIREEIKKLTLNEKWWCCGGRRGGCCTCKAIGQEIEGRIGDVSWDCCCEGNARKRRCCGGSSGQIRPITNIKDIPIELIDLEI